jgi:hypothetical protein
LMGYFLAAGEAVARAHQSFSPSTSSNQPRRRVSQGSSSLNTPRFFRT